MMKTIPLPTQEKLREILDYNSGTGELTWLKNRIYARVGCIAGTPPSRKRSGLTIKIGGKQYGVHRIIWRWMTGDDPDVFVVDHKDRNPANNSWNNLRLTDDTGNAANRTNRSDRDLPKGVYRNRGKFRAMCKGIHWGTFTTAEAAHERYLEVATNFWGEFATGGQP